MSRLTLEALRVGETRDEPFSFLSDLAAGETLSAPSSSVSVYSGTDSSPASLLSGSPSVSGSDVVQRFVGVTAGVIYLVVVQATSSSGETLQREAFLAVVSNYA